MNRPEKIKIGKIVSAVGIRGEVKVYPYTDYPERFEELEGAYAEKDIKGAPKAVEKHLRELPRVEFEKVRYQKGMVILKLRDVDDRNAAEALRDSFLMIGEEDLRELEEGKYYLFDLIGLEAVDQEGRHLGVVDDVLQNTAQDLYVIRDDEGKTHLVPGVKEIITDIDINSGIIKIKPIEGLFGGAEEIR